MMSIINKTQKNISFYLYHFILYHMETPSILYTYYILEFTINTILTVWLFCTEKYKPEVDNAVRACEGCILTEGLYFEVMYRPIFDIINEQHSWLHVTLLPLC